MKKLFIVSLLLTFTFCLLIFSDAVASVPGVINYQGKLTTKTGDLVADGFYKMIFTLYQDDSVLVWTETFDGSNLVQVTNGLFNVLLGTGDNDGELVDIFNAYDNLYLGINIDDAGEMTPHQRMASAGYVMKADISEEDNPVGTVHMYGGESAPEGWFLCDGSAISRTEYADLFAVIGTAYGAGDGSTTFNLPDLQDRFPIGKSATRSLGTTGGVETIDLSHSHTVDSHTHSISTESLNHRHSLSISLSGGDHTHGLNHNLYSLIGDTYDVVNDPDSATVGSEGHGHNLSVTLTGGSHTHSYSGNSGYSNLSHNHGGATGAASPGTSTALSSPQSILPQYQVVNYIIKY